MHLLAEVGLIEIVEPLPEGEGDGSPASSPVLRIHPMIRTSIRHHANLDAQIGEYLRLAATLLYKTAHSADPLDPRAWPQWHALAPHCTSFLSTIAG